MWPFSKKKPAVSPPPAPSTFGAEPRGGPFQLGCGADLGQGPLPVFPLLMPASYAPAPTALARPIIKGPKLPNIPWVTLCYLIPAAGSPTPNRGFIKQERAAQLGKTPADFEGEALHNVGTRPATWQPLAPGVLTCTDDYLAAERILDPAFLLKAGATLGEDSLVIGIPARGQLCATGLAGFTKSTPGAIAFKQMVEAMFQAGGELGITPWLFLVIKGSINSILEVS
jgi:hypothetical protein